MAECKACGAFFGSATKCDLCPSCERALNRLKGYAVPVVRCKDCKHLTIVNKEPVYAFCKKTELVFRMWEEDTRKHFCSYGE